MREKRISGLVFGLGIIAFFIVLLAAIQVVPVVLSRGTVEAQATPVVVAPAALPPLPPLELQLFFIVHGSIPKDQAMKAVNIMEAAQEALRELEGVDLMVVNQGFKRFRFGEHPGEQLEE